MFHIITISVVNGSVPLTSDNLYIVKEDTSTTSEERVAL